MYFFSFLKYVQQSFPCNNSYFDYEAYYKNGYYKLLECRKAAVKCYTMCNKNIKQFVGYNYEKYYWKYYFYFFKKEMILFNYLKQANDL